MTKARLLYWQQLTGLKMCLYKAFYNSSHPCRGGTMKSLKKNYAPLSLYINIINNF